MNYGYAPTPFDSELARRLEELVDNLPPPTGGGGAYIEVNGLYEGVRIRRITNYEEDVIDQLVKEADAVHKELCERHKWKLRRNQ